MGKKHTVGIGRKMGSLVSEKELLGISGNADTRYRTYR